MQKKYQREQKRRYLKKIASSYYQEQRKFKVLVSWSKLASKVNSQANNIFNHIRERCPYAAEILFLICHDFYLDKNQGDDMQDAIKFQFLVLNQFSNYNGIVPESNIRLRNHLIQRFNDSFELVLQNKQQRVIKYWRAYVNMIK